MAEDPIVTNKMIKPKTAPYSSYNAWFFLPFCLWMIAGGGALLHYDKQMLFATFNTHHNEFFDTLMAHITWMGESWLISIVLLTLSGLSRLRNVWYFLTAIACNVIPPLIIQMLKGIYNEPRPLQYFNSANWIHIRPEWSHLYNYSFPSGHSGASFSMFCFLSMLLPPKHKTWGLLFFVLALLTAYSRMYLAAHFFKDVYVGSLIGTLTTVFMFSLMKRSQPVFFNKLPSSEA